MPLCHALRIICDSRTSGDPRVGYSVHGLPTSVARGFSPFSRGEYIEAWGVVRRAVGLPTEPEPEALRDG